jgi:hypothetical protein
VAKPVVSSNVSGLPTFEEYLLKSAAPRSMIEEFLLRPRWSQFDAELGYVLHDCLVQWGIDGSRSIATFQANGARSQLLYGRAKPRINSYGDSFTEGNQVNDGETWQEYLAGHFGEPIANYGVGGYGVYQAYLRMRRQEVTEHGADNVIFYIWGDDAVRSLMRARWAASADWLKRFPGNPWKGLFHGNAWANIEMDLTTGQFVERPNPLATPDALYQMCEPEWMLETLRDDLALQLHLYTVGWEVGAPGKIRALDREKIGRLAERLQFEFDWSDEVDPIGQARRLLDVYSQRATIVILDKVRAFTQAHGKKLLVALNCTARSDSFCDPLTPYAGERADQLIVDYLARERFHYFDMNLVHQEEFESSSTGSYANYMKQYMVGGVGHYNPRGNHLFAYAIKDKVLEMLNPKPLPYRDLVDDTIDFRGYLPGA